jgi:threonine/homoserine/homoserine lactone efflux protein
MNASLLVAALAGISAGVIHALSGPDHLSAVAPLVINERSRRWRMGLFWGIGHSLGVWIIGLIALVLRGFLPIESLSSWSERLVGVVLIGVGLWGLRRAFAAKLPAPHVHDEEEQGKRRPGRAAVLIGGLHGLAGSSHVIGLLPALAFPSRGASLCYVIGFGLGAVVGMTTFSTTFGLFAHRITGRGVRAYQTLLACFSAAAILVGGYWLIS